MKTEKRDDGWWITGKPLKEDEDHGPYSTKADADDDRQGLKQFYKEDRFEAPASSA